MGLAELLALFSVLGFVGTISITALYFALPKEGQSLLLLIVAVFAASYSFDEGAYFQGIVLASIASYAAREVLSTSHEEDGMHRATRKEIEEKARASQEHVDEYDDNWDEYDEDEYRDREWQ